MKKLLEHLISGLEKLGKKPDTVLLGSDIKAEEVLTALHQLGRDMHVIADNEISPKRLWVMTSEDLAKFLGGGSN